MAQELLPQGSVFGLTALQMEYCYIGAAVLILLFALLFVAVDKKISPYYVPHKNVPAGLIGLLLSVLLAADGGLTAFQMFNSGTISVVQFLGAVLALLSAVVFVVFSLNHIFRRKEGKNLSLLNAVPAVFCGVRMILVFIQFTTISIKLADVSALICYVFATLFFYHYAVVLSLIKNKSSLKSCFVFGLPAVAMMIPYGVYHLWFRFDSLTILNNAQPLEMLLFGLYILSILIEITAFAKDKEHVTVIDKVEELASDPADEKVDGFIASNISEDQNDSQENTEYRESSDTEGYLYQDTHNSHDKPADPLQEYDHLNPDTEGYLTEIQEESDETDDRPKDYESRLDDIDKLILDISRKSE
ncbi:MAG TPA: hypothetical protein DCY72_05050 [Ruminococcaceae bacterium]|nr:hypothetical protein [Oscillospiraceae bacterium]